jgi:hypothetical protein
MPYTFYRGDSPEPKDLRGGFQAWVPLTVVQARDLVRRFSGMQALKVTLPALKKDLQETLNKGAKYTMLDLVRMVKLEKNRTTIHISTDLTEDCGGYSSGYIYEIVFADVVYFDKSGRCTEKPDSLECTSHFNTFLVADDKVLSDSNMIALSSKGNEVSFLTTIPYANIKRYKRPKSTTWTAMPA